ncbi:hypothetical protein FHX44_114860 [Pseudonocardia hierapolitana]|uniref:DUF6286 domain-containing protein n=1 Tax=Pseudonocardia hierapolitana TaxID=1128676 RepID=A0A561SVP4_9PSEU|nr:DUF6286 domain-containing protein [Pseudonocardia hierapolitana]TWF78936.1 hypothetical protein FHX44_114860 [Pseudonocardia hierapolitana]
MIRRPRRTVPATIVGLVLLVAAVVVAISCIQLIAGIPPLVAFRTLAELGRDTTWNDPRVLAAGGILSLVGLVLLACGLLPGRPQVLALAPGDDLTAAGISRRSLARDLTSHARRADGITDARVRVGARTVTVNARTPLRDRSGLPELVRELVTERLDDIDLARPARLRVTVTSDRSA